MNRAKESDGRRTRACRRCRILAACGVMVLVGPAWTPAAGPTGKPSAGAVLETAETAVDVRRETQRIRDRWAAEAETLAAEADVLERELERIRWQRGKTAAFMADLEQKTAALAAAEKASLTLQDDLGPFLDEGVRRLKTFVAQDLPLHPEERDARVKQFLRIMDDADADLPSKTRAFLEALAVEIEYGYFTEADEAELEIDGRVVHVRRLFVGRLGLFAVVDGGRRAWRWNPGAKGWEPVDNHAPRIQQALQMADRSRLASLVALPMGPPREAAVK